MEGSARPDPAVAHVGLYDMLYKYAQDLHRACNLPCDLPRLATDLGLLLGTGIQEGENVAETKDSVSYWGTHRAEHPELYELATTFLCLPASKASVERSFSHHGFIVTKLRTLLAPKVVQGIMALRLNVGVPTSRARQELKAAKKAQAELTGIDVEESEEEVEESDSDDSESVDVGSDSEYESESDESME
ncbi:hypothetical protein KIPB_016779 [Kipferlia bialata]|uniref:HAT C-terminal dimerisation domain-containing protein n=1 Tax=Kipferlia bialata TaxID=797122 RepID=A0A391NXN1_9EUKA|nr:hypothetical protein KIPB_016779 [Kipferlia bialata]|eukprot:g16779.t1